MLLMISLVYGETKSINLSSGWNFISFPKLPSNALIATVFEDVSPNIRIIWGYDNNNKIWKKFKPGAANNILEIIESGKGYWVYMNASGDINMSNWTAQSSTISLAEGWNLIGYNGADNSLANALSNISGKWTIVWNWADGQWYGKHSTIATFPVQPLTAMYQGKAYWVKINEETTYTVEVPSLSCGTWDLSLWDNGQWCQ